MVLRGAGSAIWILVHILCWCYKGPMRCYQECQLRNITCYLNKLFLSDDKPIQFR